jgi:HEAT repeat protein
MDIMVTSPRYLAFVMIALACVSGVSAQTVVAPTPAPVVTVHVSPSLEVSAVVNSEAVVAAVSKASAVAGSVIDAIGLAGIDVSDIVGEALDEARLDIEQEAGAARERIREERERQRDERERAEDMYEKGTDALDEGRWGKAIEAFNAYRAMKGRRVDGALYWKAYAQFKLAQRVEAMATLKELQKNHPSSRWIKEGRALEIEMSGAAAGAAMRNTDEDDELKLLALSSLLSSESEVVLPALEKVLKSQQSLELKKQALFVLSQSKSPQARNLVVTTAQGSANPDLQIEAIRFLGLFGEPQKLRVLSEIYSTSKDVDVRQEILGTYMIAGARDLVAQAARSEKEAELRSHAVQLLGVMHASDELQRIYEVEKSPEVRQAVVEAYMVAGDTTRILEIAKTDPDAEIRTHAIEMLGVSTKHGNTATLAGLYYASGQSLEARQAVINALFIANDATSLVGIARKETNPELRRAAVEHLSLMKTKEARDFLLELINK